MDLISIVRAVVAGQRPHGSGRDRARCVAHGALDAGVASGRARWAPRKSPRRARRDVRQCRACALRLVVRVEGDGGEECSGEVAAPASDSSGAVSSSAADATRVGARPHV